MEARSNWQRFLVGRGSCLVLALLTLAAHGGAWWRSSGVPPFQSERLWPGVPALLGLLESPPPFLVGVLCSLLIMAGGWLTTQIAIRAGLPPIASLVAGALTVVSPLAGPAYAEPGSRALLLGWVAWLAVLALESVVAPSSRKVRVAQLLCASVALWSSQAALLPALLLWWLVRQRAPRATGRASAVPRPPWKAVAVAGLVVVGVLLLRPWLPDVGLGFLGQTAPSSFAVPDPALAPVFTAAVLATAGFGGECWVLAPGRFFPELAAISSIALLFSLLMVPVAAAGVRRKVLRLGSLAVLAGVFAAVSTVAVGEVAAISASLVLPAASGLGWTLAGVWAAGIERSTVESSRTPWRVLGGALIAVLLVVSHLQHSASFDEQLRRVHQQDASMPYAAFALADRSRQESAEAEGEPLRRLLQFAAASLLPEAVEIDAGRRVARRLLREGANETALEFSQQWIDASENRRGRWLAHAHALRIEALLRSGAVDEAFHVLVQDRRDAEDPEFPVVAAEAVLGVLQDRVLDGEQTEQCVLRVEELLAESTERSGRAGVDALLALARLRLGQGRWIDAVRVAEDAARRDPRSAAPHVLLARIYLALEEQVAGLEEVQAAARIDPTDPAVRFMEGRWLATVPATASAGVDKMLLAWEEAGQPVAEVPELSAGLEAAVRALLGAGRPSHALESLNRWEPRFPEPGVLQWQRGVALLALQRRSEAIAAFESAVASDDQLDDARRQLAELWGRQGYSLLVQGERERAVELFRKVIALEADGVSVEGMRIVVENAERAAGAVEPDATAPYREDDLERARAAFDRGILAFQAEDLDAAVAAFQESIATLPDNPLAWSNLGEVEFRRGHFAQAEGALRMALSLAREFEPGLFDVERAYLTLGRCHAERGEREKLETLIEEYRARHPAGAYLRLLPALLERLEESEG